MTDTFGNMKKKGERGKKTDRDSGGQDEKDDLVNAEIKRRTR